MLTPSIVELPNNFFFSWHLDEKEGEGHTTSVAYLNGNMLSFPLSHFTVDGGGGIRRV